MQHLCSVISTQTPHSVLGATCAILPLHNYSLCFLGREVALASEEAALAPATASKAVSKKRKLEITADASSAVEEGPLQEAPKAQLQGHSQCVSGVAWPHQDTIYSGSWDHSVSVSHFILRGCFLVACPVIHASATLANPAHTCWAWLWQQLA